MPEVNPFEEKNRNEYAEIYVVRHGQTDWNILKKIQGQTNMPLNAKGFEQVREIAKELHDIQFDAVYSSDLIRAKQTAEILAIEKNLVVTAEKALGEKNYGELEGRPQEIIVNLFKKFETMAHEEIFKFRVAPSAETDEEVIERFLTMLRELSLAYRGKRILVVSHHAIMRLLLVHLGAAKYTEIPPGSIKNTAVLRILSDGVDFYLASSLGVTLPK